MEKNVLDKSKKKEYNRRIKRSNQKLIIFQGEPMDTNFKSQLEQIGADIDTAIKRFMGNEALYAKFLMKFQQDESFAKIEQFVAEKNAEETFKAAHTLKGVAANLGLDRIANDASDIVELFRGKSDFTDADQDVLASTMDHLRSTYESLMGILAKHQD